MEDIIKKIYDYSLEEIMGDRFGKYSKYIIQDRAIPDVRDGLKPVQRRILFSMYKEKNTYDKPYKKSARAVGDVMGKYHPHGDSSIYEAIVRMSQDWKMKEPFVDMQGNNGSIDGDSAAASRYTEARLSEIANEMLRDIDKDTVAMAPNYDDTLLEPTVLPSRFPNLLVNGTTGISAGYATNIPPHNLGEVIDATIYRIDNPNSRLETIMNFIKGPDFPTGAIIEGIDGIKQAYETGRGKIMIKSRVSIEKNKIMIHEIPYEVNKAILVRKMDEIRIDKKIDGVLEVRDESDKDGLQIAIDLKKDANAENILNYFYKNTELQISYNFNNVVIVNRRPMLMGLLGILDAYIAHQREIVTRRSQFDLRMAQSRYHIVEGLIKALSILDEVIKTIRASKNKADAILNLVKEYDFTEKQADAIVTLQLYRLTNTDVVALQEEQARLLEEMKKLESILADGNMLHKVIKDELKEIKKKYATSRKSEIRDEITEIKIDATSMIPKEDVMVVVTNEGYIKRTSLRSYAASSITDLTLKENDYVVGLYNMNTLDTLLIFTNLGNYLYVPVYEIPEAKWKDLGKHMSNIIHVSPEEVVVNAMPVYDFDKELYITSFTKNGMVKRTKLNEFKVSRYSKAINMMKLKGDDRVIDVSYRVDTNVLVVTKKGYGLWYKTDEINPVGIKASGVKSINLRDDEVVSGLLFPNDSEFITILTDKGTGKRMRFSEIDMGTRGNRGLMFMKEIKSNPSHVVKAYVENTKSIIHVVTDNYDKDMKLTDIPIMDRYSNGSYVVKDKIRNSYLEVGTLSKDDFSLLEYVLEKKPEQRQLNFDMLNKESLKEVDDRMVIINNFLDNVEGK
ncbi:MAG: DNA topoisomerase IV subunit A [Erysipelotrichaceae bacterium]|nr:DNA topoisomerase IV subunit A [Erysipelotrichaceae bacterium]